MDIWYVVEGLSLWNICYRQDEQNELSPQITFYKNNQISVHSYPYGAHLHVNLIDYIFNYWHQPQTQTKLMLCVFYEF